MPFQPLTILRFVLVPVLLALATSSGSFAGEPEPSREKPGDAKPDPPTYILLNDPSDLNRILNQIPPGSTVIQAPRAVVPRPAEERSVEDGRESWSRVVKSVKISGQVADERADLGVDLDVDLREDGPVWIPIRLDGKAIFSIKEGDRDIVRRCDEQKRWEIQLDRKGLHRIRVELKLFLKSILDRSVLELDIPHAAWTSLDLSLPQRISDASTGTNEPVGQISLGPGKGYRLLADIAPRTRLSVSWRKESGNDAERQPLISVQGEIALDAELESLRARASWSVRCVRGSAQNLEIALDNDDQILEVQLDDQTVLYETERAGKTTLLKIPLSEPLIPGTTRRLVFSTRRLVPPGSSPSISFKGFPFSHAKDQSGAIALVPGVNLWPDYALVQGVLRINASEMPVDLRARPGTPLAFQFLDQPFELRLSVEPSPPLASAETRTVLKLESELVQQEAWIDLQWIRGRMFDVEINIPDGLQLTSYGPPELIERSNFTNGSSSGKIDSPSKQAGRTLKIRLSPQAMDQKKITLHLEGQQSLRPSAIAQIDLFQPRNVIEIASRFAVFGSRELTLEPVDSSPNSEHMEGRLFATNDDSAGWPWLGVNPGASRPAMLLRAQGLPATLPLRVSRAPRTITHEVSLAARLGRRLIDVQQRSVCEIRHGSARSIDLMVPHSIADSWELIGANGLVPQEIERANDGSRRYRLSLPDPTTEKIALRFHFQIQLSSELNAKSRTSSEIPWIGIVGSNQRDVTLELTADPGIQIEAIPPTWSVSKEARPSERKLATQSGASLYRLNEPSEPIVPFMLQAWAVERAPLPKIVCPRSLVQTTYGYDHQLHNKAWFLMEGRSPELSFELPRGFRLVRAAIDGRSVDPDTISTDESHLRFQLRLPAASDGEPVLLLIEYDSTAEFSGRAWQPPRLLDAVAVLETFWEIFVPWNYAMIGLPTGWSDENQWFWDHYLWKRRPSKSTAALLGWLGRPAGFAGSAGESDDEFLNDSHGYLFSHAGDVGSIHVTIASRSLLIGLCSGVVLLIGFAIILSPRRYAKLISWGITFACLLAWAFLHPSVLILIAQSSMIGIILTIMGFMIQRAIERRSPRLLGEGTSSKAIIPKAQGSTMSRAMEPKPVEVGSEESTAIRVRIASTMEYQTKDPLPAQAPEANTGSKIEL